MEKKKHRSLEEILESLKDAEKEFDEKLDKYGLKVVKKDNPKEEINIQEDTVSKEEPDNSIGQDSDIIQ